MLQGREIVAKVLMVGESQVGKTSILTRLTDNYFSENVLIIFKNFKIA